jgi:hypothetical protein
MKHPFMIMAAVSTVATAAVFAMVDGSVAWADGLYWVVGNHATEKCEIVTSNPVISGDIWFADGPYSSRADAKLARSTIGACPKPKSDDE